MIDPSNTLEESDELNNVNQGKGIDKDDIGYQINPNVMDPEFAPDAILPVIDL